MLDGEGYDVVLGMYGKVFSTLEQLLHDPVASIRSAVASALGALATALREHNHLFLLAIFGTTATPQLESRETMGLRHHERPRETIRDCKLFHHHFRRFHANIQCQLFFNHIFPNCLKFFC